MKANLMLFGLLCLGLSTVSCLSTGGESTVCDDRLVEQPFNDCELERIIFDYKTMFDKRWRNPYTDTSFFCTTLNFYTENDTDKVWIVGSYEYPIVFHDSLRVQKYGFDGFLGYFKRNEGYSFIYKQLWKESTGHTYSDRLKGIVNKYLQDWRLRSESENSDFFRYDSSEGFIDPYVMEYMVDSMGKFHYLKQGFK